MIQTSSQNAETLTRSADDVCRDDPPLDLHMLGQFVMQYDEGAQGFFVDADDVQEVAQQVKAALALVPLLRACTRQLLSEPIGSCGWALGRECEAALPNEGTFACRLCGKCTPHYHDPSEYGVGA